MSSVPVPANGGVPAPNPASQGGGIKGWIEHQIAQIGGVLPKHVTPDRLARLIFGEAKRNPDIVTCIKEAPDTVINCILVAAQLGLEPGPALGQIWFIPRNMKFKSTDDRGREVERWRKELTYQLGYKGLCTLAYRSDQIALIDAEIIYACDSRRIRRGTDPGIEHEPDYDSKERTPNNIVAAYAVVQLKGGGKTFRVLNRDEIENRRMRNDAEKKGLHSPWKSDYAAMARKSALKALLQGGTVPLASEWMQYVADDNDDDNVIDAPFTVQDVQPRGGSRFAAEVGARAAQVEAPEPPPPDEPEPAPNLAAEMEAEVKTLRAACAGLEMSLGKQGREAARVRCGMRLDAEVSAITEPAVLSDYRDQLREVDRVANHASAPGPVGRNIHTSRPAPKLAGEREPGSDG